MKLNKSTIIFDVETRGIIPKTKNQSVLNQAFQKLEISVICAYDYKSGEYKFFTHKTIKHFLDLLSKAGIIVGFNILAFDYKVLKKYGLQKGLEKKSIDIFAIIKNKTGIWYSLNNLSIENGGKGKLHKGKDLAKMTGVSLYEGCKADVKETKFLYEKMLNKKLKYIKDKAKYYAKYFPKKYYDYLNDEDIDGYIEDEFGRYYINKFGTQSNTKTSNYGSCPNCKKELYRSSSENYGFGAGAGESYTGRSLCGFCKHGCFEWDRDHIPGFSDSSGSKCCKCNKYNECPVFEV